MRLRGTHLSHTLRALILLLVVGASSTALADKRPESGSSSSSSGAYRLVGWNDLGMHCVDGNDYSVFSILPPFNNVHVQLVGPDGKLIKDPTSYRLTYEAVQYPGGWINRTSIGKTNFWNYVEALFGVKLAPDMGLAGQAMPGPKNTPQLMKWDAEKFQWVAVGVPITPYNDGDLAKNYYPLMRLAARDSRGRILTTSDVVLPVSDEMDCRVCHATGTEALAMPKGGWVNDPIPDKDYKRNILRLHDERRDPSRWPGLLAKVGYNSAGLLPTSDGGKPVLCAKCHLSNALPGSGYGTIEPLTRALHGRHANVLDAANHNLPLDSVDNRSACYRCHPGSETKCLRGAMGNAVNPDGSMTMQCQSCHGSMSKVAAADRRGWLDEPSCENCHTGTAMRNTGNIRETSVFDAIGKFREPMDRRFAVQAGMLYRESAGHGNLQCEACHGSTHAEYPSSHDVDNLQIVRLQNRAGTLSECSVCHTSGIEETLNGPHGMHPMDAKWVDGHGDVAKNRGLGVCRDCHGEDLRGTVLSAALTARSFSHDGRAYSFARGDRIGCYSCHNGPNGGD